MDWATDWMIRTLVFDASRDIPVRVKQEYGLMIRQFSLVVMLVGGLLQPQWAVADPPWPGRRPTGSRGCPGSLALAGHG